ncbi:uncharacterized protein LOC119282357 isoform X2 [Triticum dicoccoides]|uniref:uncharacterized protein LOC119282357 isoform X2 n=1 Tax=Triticum dicoccoides TaxID=85692 RepID=UPI00188EFA46|nr:uncharacterized protein LOC119282357 isoform X2 [Triticum dicoccoides]
MQFPLHNPHIQAGAMFSSRSSRLQYRRTRLIKDEDIINHLLRIRGRKFIMQFVIPRKIAGFCDQWKILCKKAARDRVERLISSLWETARRPPLLIWPEPG